MIISAAAATRGSVAGWQAECHAAAGCGPAGPGASQPGGSAVTARPSRWPGPSGSLAGPAPASLSDS